jgi:hypothetical protein
MGRAIAREESEHANAMEDGQPMSDRVGVDARDNASIIAAVRLARDDIRQPPSNVEAVVADSVALAKMIQDRVARLA